MHIAYYEGKFPVRYDIVAFIFQARVAIENNKNYLLFMVYFFYCGQFLARNK